MKSIQTKFEAINNLKIFEIDVFNKRTQQLDYIIFEIFATEFELIAQHEGLTQQECESEKIAYKAVNIDEDFTIDENLQELYDECIQAIIDSEYFELP